MKPETDARNLKLTRMQKPRVRRCNKGTVEDGINENDARNLKLTRVQGAMRAPMQQRHKRNENHESQCP